MELREFLTVHRAFGMVRADVGLTRRLSFSEFATLCCLDEAGGTLRTSEIAARQATLRPTMTHRASRLCDLGLIERVRGDPDRRGVNCVLTREGAAIVGRGCGLMCATLAGGSSLARTSPKRMACHVSAAGSAPCSSGELVLLLLGLGDVPCSVVELADGVGMPQPTVSMAVASLTERGLVLRVRSDSHAAAVMLTESGSLEFRATLARVEGARVRRRR